MTTTTTKRPKRSLLRRLGIVALVLFLIALPSGYAFMEYSTKPEFCSSCHNMVPYVKSWEDSSHGRANVGCIDCHFEPGVIETLEGKFKASTQLVKYVTSTEGSKPWAQVSDASCMRSGCHNTRLLEGKVDFKIGRTSIAFDHTPHLTEMRREKKLRCTSCHSQIVQGQHLTVTATTCLLCHFKGAEDDPKLSQCTTCHTPPAEPVAVGGGFEFEHAGYVARGVACATCHSDLTQGTGEVPKHRCQACHAIQEHIDRYPDTEFLHQKHVTDHKVDCLECHTEMTHQVRAPAKVAPGGCAQCHGDGHGIAEAFYRGEGGRGVAATPNPMFLTRVGCSGCHREFGADASAAHAALPKSDAVAAKEAACVSCHGPAYDGMLGRWQQAFGPAGETVAAEVAAALAAAEKAGDAGAALRPALEDARHDAALVVKDKSRGVHNPWFARKLLDSAFAASQDAWAKLDPSRPRAASPLTPPFPTKQDCATVCHVGIEQRKIGVTGTRFDHATHVMKSGRDCDSCHSVAEHGKTLPAAKDCAACHHAPEATKARDCATCHRDEDLFLRGVSADGEQGAQMMAKVTCRECHGDMAQPPAGGSVRALVQTNCNVCHKEKYAGTVAEWTSDSDEWFEEADARLAKIRARVAAGKTTQEKAAAAEAVVERMRRAKPAHNVLAFEEAKEAFEEAASQAEK
jgi:nitrate/TMAO reductase-like tetraheme cytochrome c subunit